MKRLSVLGSSALFVAMLALAGCDSMGDQTSPTSEVAQPPATPTSDPMSPAGAPPATPTPAG
jgi:hypothetical protein